MTEIEIKDYMSRLSVIGNEIPAPSGIPHFDYLFSLGNDKSKEITEKGRELVRKMCEEFNLKID